MRNRIIAVCTALLLGTLALLQAPAAHAHGSIPIPTATLTSAKFWPVAPRADICVAVGATSIPIGASAQLWNNATFGALGLNAAGNCTTERDASGHYGYPPSRRMTIDTYSAADGRCVKFTNVSPYPTYFAYNDTYTQWTNNPVGWVNTYYASCVGSSLLRQKMTSIAIGFLLGARILSGPSWDGRGMSLTSEIYGPSANTDGNDVGKLYNDYFWGIY